MEILIAAVIFFYLPHMIDVLRTAILRRSKHYCA